MCYGSVALGLLPKPAQGRCPWTLQGAVPLDPSALARTGSQLITAQLVSSPKAHQ